MKSEDNFSKKRIAKNTLLLYVRMLLIMIVTLYTSRIILKTLGVEDYGIYNVVAGFVTMFGLLNNAMAVATQRFLSYEIGKKDNTQLNKIFSMSINIHIIIGILVVIIAEIIGLWFINNKLTIPIDRISAAQWVYHFSILSLFINIISVPYNAAIIAHEHMSVFAWVSIIEAILKLLILFLITSLDFDNLKSYAVFMFTIALLVRLMYGYYCKIKLKNLKYIRYWHKQLFNTLISYAGWNLFGNTASIAKEQGINVLLNIFFGPSINAARALAYQVGGAVQQFMNNFQVAINPQIIKSYASNDLKNMHLLIYMGSKYSFFLLLFLSLPIFIETEPIIEFWLDEVPEYTSLFIKLIIINALINSFSGLLMTAAHASGRIRKYQIIVSTISLMNLPLSYVFLKLGYEPYITIYISICISIAELYARLKIISPLVNLSINEFIKKVIYTSTKVLVSSIILPIIIYLTISNNILQLTLTFGTCFISVLLCSYIFGLEKSERIDINDKITKYIKK